MIDKIENSILIHELQLDNKLNECVASHNRAEFSLLLSMLSQDVNDFSEFHLPETTSETPEISDDILRQLFNLPEKAPLALESVNDISLFNEADKIANNQILDIKFIDALKPKPLAFRDNVNHISSQILSNTTLACQKKHHSKNNNKSSLVDQYTFNAKQWLDSVQQTIVKSSLIPA